MSSLAETSMFIWTTMVLFLEEFRGIVSEEASRHNINPIKVNKVLSEQNKCIQLVDFIAGAARTELEHSDSTINVISRKVSVARRH